MRKKKCAWERRKKRERKEKGYDSRCSNCQKSIGRELKFSTRRELRVGAKNKQKEVMFSPTLVPPNLRTVNGRVV